MKKIKTFEAACKLLKIAVALPVLTGLPEKHAKAIIAHYKLVIIAQALNGGWEPNWSNSNEGKYYPWFDMRAGTGYEFAYYYCSAWRTSASAGSRLCFKSSTIAEYAGKTFVDLYKDYFVIDK